MSLIFLIGNSKWLCITPSLLTCLVNVLLVYFCDQPTASSSLDRYQIRREGARWCAKDRGTVGWPSCRWLMCASRDRASIASVCLLDTTLYSIRRTPAGESPSCLRTSCISHSRRSTCLHQTLFRAFRQVETLVNKGIRD